MENNHTPSYLNSKIWYRCLKVFYIFVFAAFLLVINFFIFSEGIKNVDQDRTVIACTYGNKNSFSPKNIGVTLYKTDFLDEPWIRYDCEFCNKHYWQRSTKWNVVIDTAICLMDRIENDLENKPL